MIEEHYTPKEVAERLHVSEDTIYRAMQREGRNRLQSVRPPGMRARRIPQSALDTWLASGREPE